MITVHHHHIRLTFLLFVTLFTTFFTAGHIDAQLNQIKTDHFYIYYEAGAEGTARRVADIAEEVFSPLASLYNYYDSFAPIHILVIDNTDYSNGAAGYYENVIFIWATNLDFELRGTHDWIKDTLTHELTHIITLNTAKKKLPFNFGLFGWGKVGQKRKPDYVLNLPYYHLNVPEWFSEGIAQYEDDRLGHESWDTHRDMLLRMATLEDDLLSYNDMGIFHRDDYHGEMVYNQGYALLLYVGKEFGYEKVAEMTRHIGAMNFDKTVEKTLGISASELYDRWVRSLEEKYGTMAREIQPTLKEGTKLIDEGFVDYFPSYSPDGTKIAYLSNKDEDFSITKLRIRDLRTGKAWTVDDRVESRVRWSPDGKQIIYAKSKRNFFDIFLYDVTTQQKRQISINLRAKDPAISPDGTKIAFVRNEDGTNNLGLMKIDGSQIRYLTQNNDATQYYCPVWSTDGKQIVFSIFRGHDRDIAIVNADAPTILNTKRKGAQTDTTAFPDSLAFSDSLAFRSLLHTTADERDPVWAPDGKAIYFSSDRTGIFNIYRYDIENGEVSQVSNVLGGAFVPSLSPDGYDLVYAGYHAANYSIYHLRVDGEPGSPIVLSPITDRDYRHIFKGKSLKDEYSVGRYSGHLTISSIVPVISFEPTFIGTSLFPNQITLGLQISAGDLLGRNQFSGSATVGKNRRSNTDLNTEFELFYEKNLQPVFAENRVLSPSFYAGIYKRNVHNSLKRGENGVVDSRTDTLGPLTLQARVDSTETRLYQDVTAYIKQTLNMQDRFTNGFTLFYTGSQIQLTRRQSLLAEYVYRNYSESFFREAFIHTQPRYERNTLDITDQIPRDPNLFPSDLKVLDNYFYENMRYYKSNDIGIFYEYFKLKPTIDRFVNPTGGRVITLAYRRINATVTDSLLSPPTILIGVDTNGDGNFDSFVNEPLDPTADLRRPDKTNIGLNEYLLSWHELISLPVHRHTLWLWLLTSYRDQKIKEFNPESDALEGAYYWPLRYYMGGNGLLRAYPYFALSGSKIFYSRAMYTFPLIPDLGARILNINFDKLYASLFAEAGGAWNFASFKRDYIRRDDILTDAGVELRLQLFTFYRISMIAFFRATWALDRERAERIMRRNGDLGEKERIDRRRYFFGVSF